MVERQAVRRRPVPGGLEAANGNPPFTHPTLKLDPAPFLTGPARRPTPEESGWKDTVRTPAGEVTWIRIRWAPQQHATGTSTPGVNQFPFDPMFGIGFVWHCHLVEHEDNEMMRPMTVIPTWAAGVSYPVGFRGSPGVARGLVDFNGVDYSARVAHTSVAGQTPNTRPDLWERINNQQRRLGRADHLQRGRQGLLRGPRLPGPAAEPGDEREPPGRRAGGVAAGVLAPVSRHVVTT